MKNLSFRRLGRSAGVYGTLSFITALISLTACGYDTPTGGGGLTPYVVVVTPTTDPVSLVAKNQLTAPASNQTASTTPVNNTVSATKATNTTSLAPTLVGNIYTVQKGDTLRSIATKLGVDAQAIIKLNNIADPDNLQIDQKLQIPTKAKAATPTPGS